MKVSYTLHTEVTLERIEWQYITDDDYYVWAIDLHGKEVLMGIVGRFAPNSAFGKVERRWRWVFDDRAKYVHTRDAAVKSLVRAYARKHWSGGKS